jgi:hypothetical protein
MLMHVPDDTVSHLETLTLGFLDCSTFYQYQNHRPSVSAAVRIVQSIISSAFRRLTIMLREPSVDWRADVEWTPLVFAVENLCRRLGPAIRLQVHVWLVGVAWGAETTTLSSLDRISRFADLHMHSIIKSSRDVLRYGVIPEFPLATLSDHRGEFEGGFYPRKSSSVSN